MSFSDTINATTINASKFYKDGEVVNHSHIASGDITASEIKLSDGTNETLLIPFTSQDGNIYGLKINPLYDNENGVNIVNNTSRNKISVGIGTNNANGINLTIGDSNNDINKLPDNVYDSFKVIPRLYHGLHCIILIIVLRCLQLEVLSDIAIMSVVYILAYLKMKMNLRKK